jgi:hypothetical protein
MTNTNYALLGTVGSNVISYSDMTVTPGNTYYYHVKAYNLLGESTYSNELSGLTAFRPLSVDTPPTDNMVWDVTCGYRFSSSINGQIIGLGRYIGSGAGNTRVILWDDLGNQIISATVSSAVGWQWITLPTPVNITAGTYYRVSVSCSRLWYKGGFSPLTRRNITITESRYGFGLDVFPNTTLIPTVMYGWADIEFVSDE